MKISVLQSWLEEIPIRMQSTLLLGLRGPDTPQAPETKKIIRWLRGLAFKPGNPDNVKEFMGSNPPEIIEKGPVNRELDCCPHHFYSHLMHALEVVAYRHPDPEVSTLADRRFIAMCDLMHVTPETRATFEARLHQIDWPGQPDTFDEAINIILDT